MHSQYSPLVPSSQFPSLMRTKTLRTSDLPRGAPFLALDESFSAAVRGTDTSLDLSLFHKIGHAVTTAFLEGKAPRLTDPDSTGGAYFVTDVHGNPLAVVKNADEEVCVFDSCLLFTARMILQKNLPYCFY